MEIQIFRESVIEMLTSTMKVMTYTARVFWLIYQAMFLHNFCIFSEKLELLVEDEIVVWRMVINA